MMKSPEQIRCANSCLRGTAKLVLVSLFLVAFATVSHAKVSVFFYGGQSNVSPGWGEGIRQTLIKSGQFDEVLIVCCAHPGKQSDCWVNKDPGNYYLTDFFAPDGSGALQKKLAELKEQKKDYKFEGAFWFQGEAMPDRQNPKGWESNFLNMIASARKDLTDSKLSDSNWKVVVCVIDINRDDVRPSELALTKALREVQLALPSRDPNIIVSDSHGYERVDTWHLKRETGAYQFGCATAHKFLESIRHDTMSIHDAKESMRDDKTCPGHAEVIWWESEASTNTTMGLIEPRTPQPEDVKLLSGGKWVSGKVGEGQKAEYDITVKEGGRYWLYMRRLNHNGAYRWRFDDGEWVRFEGPWQVEVHTDSVKTSHGPLVWVEVQGVNLKPGPHTFQVEVLNVPTYPFNSDYAYDCFMLSNDGFIPHGRKDDQGGVWAGTAKHSGQ